MTSNGEIIITLSEIVKEVNTIINYRFNHFNSTAKIEGEGFWEIARWFSEEMTEGERLTQWAERVIELELENVISYELEYLKNTYDNFIFAEEKIKNIKSESFFGRLFAYHLFVDYHRQIQVTLKEYSETINIAMPNAVQV